MRIAVFSDLHGNYQATKAILDDISKESFDKVICLGDIIGIGPKPKETLELVLNSGVEIVLGNHDLYYIHGIGIDSDITEPNEIAHHKWVHESVEKYTPRERLDYPLFKELNIDGKVFRFEHYMLKYVMDSDPYPYLEIGIKNMKDLEDYCSTMPYDYMFVGHEHRGFNIDMNNKHLICVGSSGCVNNNKTFYTIIDTSNNNVSITKKEIEFDRESFIEDLKSFDYPDRDFICKYLFGIEL